MSYFKMRNSLNGHVATAGGVQETELGQGQQRSMPVGMVYHGGCVYEV